MKDFVKERFLIIGQIGGYGAGAMSFMGVAKDALGFVGVACGAALSVWALWDRIQRARGKRSVSNPPFEE